MKPKIKSNTRANLSLEVVSTGNGNIFVVSESEEFSVLGDDESAAELSAQCNDSVSSAQPLDFEEIMAPLVGTLATLKTDGSISYDFHAPFGALNCEGLSGGVRDESESIINFGMNWEGIDQEDMLAPLVGTLATMNSNGSIHYASKYEAMAAGPEFKERVVHHAPWISSLDEPETVALAR